MSRMCAPVTTPSLGDCPRAHHDALEQCSLLCPTNAASIPDGPGCCLNLQSQMQSTSVLKVPASIAVALGCVALLAE